MTILKLEKVKLGEEYPIVRITYKTLFGVKKTRDVYKNPNFWEYCDTGDYVIRDKLLDLFYKSSERTYTLNQ